MGYFLILSLSVAVGVIVYRLTAHLTVDEQDPAMWAAAPAEQAPPPPPTNFERLSISTDRLTWHDRLIGSLGLVVAVAVGAAAVAFGVYLIGVTLLGFLKQAAEGSS